MNLILRKTRIHADAFAERFGGKRLPGGAGR
jgi:hypothetical protein